MKEIFQTLRLLLLISVFCTQVSVSLAQKEKTLPEIKMPAIPDTFYTKKGWVGQFVYEMHFDGKSSLKASKGEIPYYRIKSDRVHTGNIEFAKEVKGAIYTNQPDGYNKERYESWIPTWTGKSWSKLSDSIKTILYSGVMGDIVNTGTIETNTVLTSKDKWVEGKANGSDMQIDYKEGKFVFSVPDVSFEIEEEVWGVKTNFKPEKKENFQRKNKTRIGIKGTYLQFGEWYRITSSFQKGQKEIIIRERIPVLLQQTTTQGGKEIKLPAVNGFMEFYLKLVKVG